MKKLLSFISALALALSMSAMLPVTAETTKTNKSKNQSEAVTYAGDYVEGEAIVCYKSKGTTYDTSEISIPKNAKMEIIADTCDTVPGNADYFQVLSQTHDNYAVVSSKTLTTAQLIKKLEAEDNVEFAEPNYKTKISEESSTKTSDNNTSAIPDYTDLQWGFNSENGVNLKGWNTDSPEADAEGVVVAVLDTGIDYTNPDLANVMWTADDELISKIGGGEHGYNAVEVSKGNKLDETQCMDDFGHGTHCAGIIGAEWNGYGVSGIAKGAKLMAVKTNNSNGNGNVNDIVEGLEYVSNAVSAGVNVRVINFSLGGYSKELSINKMIKHLGEQGVVVSVCSGNYYKDIDKEPVLASYMKYIDSIVVVNASKEDGELAAFSDYGTTTTDIAAPGVDIYSTYSLSKLKSGYRYDDGTSMAAPVVTGEAAILAKAFPNDNADKIAARIIGSARTYKNLTSTSVSGGIADIHKALTEDYVPVINRADVNENGKKVTLSGYFFGDKQGTLNIDGTDFKVTSWSDEQIVATIPDGFEGGNVYVKVSGPNGSNYQKFAIGKAILNDSYEQLKLPNDSTNFAKLILLGMVGLNGKIYVLNTDEDYKSIFVWCYDIKNKSWNKIKTDSSKVPYKSYASNVCTYGNNLMIGMGKGIALFDTKTNKWSYHKLNIIENSTIVNTGTDIYSLGGMDDDWNYSDTIFHIDLKNSTVKK